MQTGDYIEFKFKRGIYEYHWAGKIVSIINDMVTVCIGISSIVILKSHII